MDDTTNQGPSGRIGTVLVTGASRGLGLEFARSWLARGAYVIATARNPGSSDELGTLHRENPEQLRLMQLDVKEERSVELLTSALGNTPIDLLLNNAGVLHVETLANMD